MTNTPDAPLVHRREIDGLRAFAILPVLFFHFALPGVGGGFVGVDVFFVISGFLIGGILWKELTQTGRLRLGRFFLRRIRRLAPAYFAMAIASLVAAWFILLPFEFREFGKELIASTVYLSNVHFFRAAGYFDVTSDQKVLLHSWSLSVEEQFYIFLPFLLLLFAPLYRALPAILIALGLGSLLAGILMTPLSQTAAFYLFPFRAWELLAGVCLAILGQKYCFSWSVHALLSWLGLGLILGSVILIPSGNLFPGFLALFPVLGTVLVIGNGQHDNPVNSLLKQPVPVFFGLISYSLYLWHWPLITLAKYYADGMLLVSTRILLMGLAICLAWVSMRLIETPIRRGTLGAPALLAGTVLTSALLLTVGGAVYLQDGMINRFGPQVRTHIAASADFLQDWQRCKTPASGPFSGIELCPIGPEGPPEVIIWGDSHVRAFKEGIEQAAVDAAVPGVIIWQAGCPPLLGIGKEENSTTQVQDAACARSNAQIAAGFPSLEQARSLVLIGRWSYYAEGKGVGLDEENTIRLFATNDTKNTTLDQVDILARAWEHSIDILSVGFPNIYILQQVPEIAEYGSREMARKLAHGYVQSAEDVKNYTSVSRVSAETRALQSEAIIASIAMRSGIHVLQTWPRFCTDVSCSVLVDGDAGYFDNNHITNSTSVAVRDVFNPAFQRAKIGAPQ